MENDNNVREFQKYKSRGAYHWEQVSSHLIKRNAFALGRYKNILNLLNTEFVDLTNKSILDIGCGDGVLSSFIAKKGAKVSGIDYSDIAIDYAKEKTKDLEIYFRQGSAYELPFEDNSFDAIVSSDVIEHLEDVPQYLSEINRVCKNNAKIIISTPIKYTQYPHDKEHIVEWFEDEFKIVIEKEFKNSKYFYSHPLALQEIYEAIFFGRVWGRVFINLYSLLSNPFEGFQTRFKQKSFTIFSIRS